MTLYTQSRGILRRQCQIEPAMAMPLARLDAHTPLTDGDVLITWGNKPSGQALCAYAAKHSLPLWRLEDSFIGYAGHPAGGGLPLGLVWDDQGIYYDARRPSRLEQLIAAPISAAETARTEALLARIRALGITKYNTDRHQEAPFTLPSALAARLGLSEQLPDRDERASTAAGGAPPTVSESNEWPPAPEGGAQPLILLVDQVAGDGSIEGALASEMSFVAMVKAARERHPGARLLLRTHPDTRFGKKRGVLARRELPDVEVISEACHPHALIRAVAAVYTVSSQLGFEALLLGKPVYCFGLPFYAGWGLTTDALTTPRRQPVTLAQLAHAALIAYPRYVNPVLGTACEVEEIIDLLAGQQHPAPRWQRLYLVGFSLWKRAFMREFCQPLARDIRFVRRPPAALKDGEQLLVWGSKWPDVPAIRAEDGFIRSRGLGSDLCRPSSLCLDPVGIYFDSRSPSRLEQILNHDHLSEAALRRGATLIARLRERPVSKYNLAGQTLWQPPMTDRPLVLVVGQVEGDASLLTGSPQITGNAMLLAAVRRHCPEAHILFKPHPDVVAGNRQGGVDDTVLGHCVDTLVTDVSLAALYPHLRELHTMTSLSGFEALVQGVPVVTWGQPFYAGWGLTDDRCPPPRRERPLTLAALVYGALVAYPDYIDWQTRLRITPEQLMTLIAREQGATHSGSALHRWRRKLGYLLQTLLPTLWQRLESSR